MAIAEDQFLAACFRHCTEKPRVDFAKLAITLGMSTGGASNKFRAIMKRCETVGNPTNGWNDGDSTAPAPSTPGAKRRVPARKRNKATTPETDLSDDDDDGVDLTSDDDDDNDDDDDDAPPKKKIKRSAKVKGNEESEDVSSDGQAEHSKRENETGSVADADEADDDHDGNGDEDNDGDCL